MKLIGPKCSGLLLFFSSWGVIMLLLMGVFARVNAVSFAEDIPLDQKAWIKNGYPPSMIDDAYVLLSNNCFIAAAIYLIILIFSGVQFYFNRRASYMIH